MPGSPTPVRADRGMFLTVGVPFKKRSADRAVKRAVETLKREGFQAGITSDDAVVAAADLIRNEREDTTTEGW